MATIERVSENYKVTRETRALSRYQYEFVLYINGKELITASEVEQKTELKFGDVLWSNFLEELAEEYLQNKSLAESIDSIKDEY